MKKFNVNKLKEKVYKFLIQILAFASLIFLLGITAVLIAEGILIFKVVNIIQFLFGIYWYPTYDPPEFGILPLILGSLWVTMGAMFVAVPLGIGSALYLHELASHKLKSVLKPIIELLGSIPSVIYGFFGLVFVAPIVQRTFNLPTGLCAFTASLILGFMAVPIICSISEDALSYVPQSFREASFALGANRWQTLTKVVIPAAGSGISTSVILGISRVVGETMSVLMISGGAAIIPKSFFEPVRPITSTIAAEMGEAVVGSEHYHALFALGLILFVITLIFNIIAELISRKFRLKLGIGR